MADLYDSFTELQAAEPAQAWMIRLRDLGSPVAVVAPHAGRIESGTSDIALAIAGAQRSYYLFEGRHEGDNRRLHLTSTRFDEPSGLDLARRSGVVLTVHGEVSEDVVVWLGGLHMALRETLEAVLVPAGYAVREHERLRGRHPRNLCNLGREGAGVQLELSTGLRRRFFDRAPSAEERRPTPELAHFASLVDAALQRHGW